MRTTKLAVLIPSLVLALSAAPVLATTQFWSPTGTVGSTGGLWDTATANWNTSFTSGGGTTWVQGNDAALTIGVTYSVTVSGQVTVGNVTVLGVAGALTLVQTTTANTLCFPTGNWNFDTGSRIVSEASGSGFNSVAGTVLTKKGTGTLSLQPAGGFSGKWVIQDGGFFSLGSQGAYFGTSTADDTVTLNNGGIRLSAGIRTISGTGITIGAGGGQLQSGAANLTIDVTAKVSGSGGFTFNSTVASASVVLDNAANAFTGPVTIMGGGICKIGVAGGMPSGRDISVATSGTTFDLNGTALNVNSIASSAGTIAIGAGSLTVANPSGQTVNVFSGTGKFIKNGTGTIILSGSSTGFTGEFIVNNGTAGVGGINGFGGSAGTGLLTINGGKIANTTTSGRTMVIPLNVGGSFAVDDSLISGPGQISFNSGAITLKAANPVITVSNSSANLILPFSAVIGQDVAGRGFTKAGNGQITLNGENTYTGNTTISNGLVSINGTVVAPFGSGGTLVLAGGTLITSASRSASTAPISNPLNVTADSAVTTSSTAAGVDLAFTNASISATAGTTLTFRDDAASGTGSFQPRFSASFTYPGKIAISNGTFGTTVLQSYNPTGTDQTFNDVISGTGSYVRNASSVGTGGRTIFTAANTYSGGTTVSRGTLLVNNTTGSGTGSGAVSVGSDGTLGGTGSISGTVTIASGGTLSPGASIGTLNLSSSPSLSGTTVMEVNNTGSPNADKLAVSGNPLAFGGILTVNNIGPTLVGGETFDLFDATAFSGSFTATNLPSLGAGLNWWTPNLGVDGTITVNRAPVAADKTYARAKGATVKIFKSDLMVGASDPDSGDSASFDALVNSGSNGTVTQDASVIYYEPNNDLSDTLQYRVKDTRGGATTKNIAINVVDDIGQPTTLTVSGSTATIGFAGIPGLSYQVQRSTNMVDWVTLVTTNAPSNGVFEWVDDFSDLGAPPATAYYQLRRP